MTPITGDFFYSPLPLPKVKVFSVHLYDSTYLQISNNFWPFLLADE